MSNERKYSERLISFARYSFLCLAMIVVSLPIARPASAETAVGPTAGTYTEETDYAYLIESDVVWKKTDTLVFDKPVYVYGNESPVKLTIEPGAEIHINGGSLSVYSGFISASGTQDDPITFLSDNESEYSIEFYGRPEDGESVLSRVRIQGGGSFDDPDQCDYQVQKGWDFLIKTAHAGNCPTGTPAVSFVSGDVRIEYADFTGSKYADIEAQRYIDTYQYVSENSLTVSNSSLADNLQDTALILKNKCARNIDSVFCSLRGKSEIQMVNDWFGSAEGPSTSEHPNDSGKKIVGEVVITGWMTIDPFKMISESEASNVLFLPGIKASKLYKATDAGGEDQLWPPSLFGNDLWDLRLEDGGESVNRIYTNEVLQSAGPSDIYKSFLEDLGAMKSGGVINDFEPFAYDWRRSVKDVAYGNTAYRGDYRSLLERTEGLARSSKTGKVTIIAHSNGGLVAKELLLRLDAMGESGLVDRVVFVGTPQMGAPISILSLLYGYDEDILGGLLASRADARALAENMPGAYGLLPSAEYFRRSDDPVVSFSSEHTRFASFLNSYGSSIGDWDELADFLSGGTDAREKPEKNDVRRENILHEFLLGEAETIHDGLDSWKPPAGVEAIQIAGWGVDTIRGVDYAEKKHASCYPSAGGVYSSCVESENEYDPIYEPKFTVDGDGVVPAPSALLLPEASNVKRYWVDLYRSRKIDKNGKNHGTLFESDALREYIKAIIVHSDIDQVLPDYLYKSRPSDYSNAKPRIRMSLYSPLDVHLTDASGNHTGSKEVVENGVKYMTSEEGIPGSSFYRFDDRKYVSFPAGEPIDIRLDGYDAGSYTLKLEEVAVTPGGEETISRTTFANLPVTPETTVELSVPAEGLGGLSSLRADLNGADPGGEYVVQPIPNGEATFVADARAPETTATLAGARGTNDWFTDSVTISFLSDDGAEGSGVDRTEYSLDEGVTWNIYGDPMTVKTEGETVVMFASVDTVGNREATKSVKIRIDRVAPEARFGFDPEKRTVFVSGTDSSDGPVTVSTVKSALSKRKHVFRDVSTLTDEAGHETVLVLERSEKDGNLIGIVPMSVTYDGIRKNIEKSEAEYQWFPGMTRKGYQFLTTRLRNGSESLDSFYFPWPDTTLLIRYPEPQSRTGRKPIADWLPGMVIPAFETEGGSVDMVY